MIGREEFLLAFVTEHACECMINSDGFALRVASKYSVRGIIHKRSIERLGMPQGLSGILQFLAKFPFVQGLTNCHGQLSDAVSVHIVECSIGRQLSERLNSCGVGHEEQRSLLQFPMKELQCLGSFHTREGVFGNHNIVGLRAQSLRALRQVQDKIGVDRKLCFLKLFYAVVYHLSVPVGEKDPERAPAVRVLALRVETCQIRLQPALSQV